MSKLRLSHSQRELYSLCGRKYYYRYIKKMRPKAKGSALPFGTAFDEATEVLFKGGTLAEAQDKFSDIWMLTEDNLMVKFAKTDFVGAILERSDLDRLELAAQNLNNSKPKQEFAQHGNVLQLVKDFAKFRDSSYIRDLSDEEIGFMHYTNVLCMNRKGRMMLESFNKDILPHISKLVGTQVKIAIKHPDGHEVTGFIDVLCEMAGYTLPNGRVLKEGEVVVLDVKSAGTYSWKKHDDLHSAPQLDTYLISEAVQEKAFELSGKETNLVGYAVTSKNPIRNSLQICKKCGNVKSTSHRTCNAEVNGERCNGDWGGEDTYYCESKLVIGERNLDEARLMFQDFEDTLVGIQAGSFPRDRNSCNAFNSVCEYYHVCNKVHSCTETAIERWKQEYGE
jgi:hypothetical protein